MEIVTRPQIRSIDTIIAIGRAIDRLKIEHLAKEETLEFFDQELEKSFEDILKGLNKLERNKDSLKMGILIFILKNTCDEILERLMRRPELFVTVELSAQLVASDVMYGRGNDDGK